MRHHVVAALLLFLALLPMFGFASLPTSIPITETTQEVAQDSTAILLKQIKKLAKAKNYLDAIALCEKLELLSQQNKDTAQLANTYFRLGFYYNALEDLPTSFDYYGRSYGLYLQLQDSVSAASRLTAMAYIQKSLGDYSGCKVTALEALELLGKNAGAKKLADIYHTISVALKEEGNNGESKIWNDKIMELLKTNPKSFSRSIQLTYHNTRALILAKLQRYPESIDLLAQLLQDSVLSTKPDSHARIMDNFGWVSWQGNHNVREAETQMLRALEMRKTLETPSGLIASCIHLTQFYQSANPEKALKYATMALENAEKIENPVAILEALDLAIPLKTRLGLAVDHEAERYILVNTQLKEAQQKVRNLYTATKYNNSQLTQQNLLLKAKTAQREKQRAYWIFSFVLLLCVSGFLVYHKDQQRRRERAEAVIRTEAQISKKVHDELANDVYGVMNYVDTGMESEMDAKDRLLGYLNDIYQRARDISTANAAVDVSDFPKALRNLFAQHNPKGVQILTNPMASVDWTSISNTKKTALYKSLQELLINTKKHANANLISIVFKKEGKRLLIVYSDDGVGFDPQKKNFGGLHNVGTRMKESGGKFSFESIEGKGFTAKMLI